MMHWKFAKVLDLEYPGHLSYKVLKRCLGRSLAYVRRRQRQAKKQFR
jgi:hypothetical protein